MDDMQTQMRAILDNPEMMQSILTMAQSLNSPADKKDDPPQPKKDLQGLPIGDIDISMLQRLSSLAGKSHVDTDQRSLLNALRPYLSNDRINKLERAMRAAKLASLASGFLNSSGLKFHSGR